MTVPGTTDVDDAQLAAREERIRARLAHRLELERLAHRRSAADHEALDMAVVQRISSRDEQLREQIVAAQLLRRVEPDDHVRMGGLENFHAHGLLLCPT